MRIAIVHYRGGLMDGVSLEMEKWKKVLKRMGHDVDIVAGNEADGVDVYVKSIGFENPSYEKIKEMFFMKLETSEKVLKDLIEKEKQVVLDDLEKTLSEYDVIIVNNIWSLALSIPVGLAFEEYAKKGKTFIGHHHDFWWERAHLRNPTTEWGRRILEEHFPPDLPNLKHVVINSVACHELKRRKNIEATVVPNVYDFSHIFTSEKLKQVLRRRYGIDEGTVVALQATRITERKAIEIAVELISVMKDMAGDFIGRKLYDGRIFNGNVVLAFSGLCERESHDYMYKIVGKAFEKGVETINLYRDVERKIYSFWDMYSIADFVTYPTILEGWGNQLLEAMAAGKPIVLFEYEIFERDIKSSGINYVSLGSDFHFRKDGFVEIDKNKIEKAAKEIYEILFSPERYRKLVEENFKVGKRYFSFERLEILLKKLIGGGKNGRTSEMGT